MIHIKIKPLCSLLVGLIIIMTAGTACNDTAEQKKSYRDTPAWKSFQEADSLYHGDKKKTALHIVDSLIADDATGKDLADAERGKLMVYVYRLRTQIMSFLNNVPEMEESARKTAEVCRSLKDIDDGTYCVMVEMDMFLGTALTMTGKKEEGYQLMDKAIHQLDGHNSWESKQAQISFMHKLAAQYSRVETAQRLDSVSRLALDKLAALPGQFKTLEGFTDEADGKGFVDFFTGKFLAWRAHAFINKSRLTNDEKQKEAYRDSARVCVGKAMKTNWSKSPDADILLFDIYPYIGMYAQAEKSADVVSRQFGRDTLNNMYVNLLRSKAYQAERQGDLKQALEYQRRADDAAAKTYYTNIQSQMAQTLEAHQLDNERQAHLETRLHLQQLIIATVLLVVLLACSITYYLYRQRRHRELYEQFRAIIAKYESDTQGEEPATDNVEKQTPKPTDNESLSLLYARIMTVMKEQKPYKDSSFDASKLAGMVFSNRTYVSQAINQISGKNFHAWLADYRNNIAIQALRSNPDLTVIELCTITGHGSKETFSRQFKQLNGITFTEFRKQLK